MPSRAGGQAGDHLWVSGTIGDSGAGLRGLQGEMASDPALIERYRNPRPRLEAGARLAPLVGAMMDVSDGLLIDASRLADASGVAAEIDLGSIPLSDALLAASGDGLEARLSAATAGDDYELLFAARPGRGGGDPRASGRAWAAAQPDRHPGGRIRSEPDRCRRARAAAGAARLGASLKRRIESKSRSCYVPLHRRRLANPS